eukprot:1380219-Pyramimonas_sp.AAC.1
MARPPNSGTPFGATRPTVQCFAYLAHYCSCGTTWRCCPDVESRLPFHASIQWPVRPWRHDCYERYRHGIQEVGSRLRHVRADGGSHCLEFQRIVQR